MPSVRGVVIAVQEARFQLAAYDGRVMRFLLSHKAAAEPQDLPPLQAAARSVRVEYEDGGHLIAAIARNIEVEE